MSSSDDPLARESPAAERNKVPILAVLARVLPESGHVLEIASGTGQHVVHFARALPLLDWQPSDPDAMLRASICAHIAAQRLENVAAPLDLDVLEPSWSIARADAVLCSNLIHIAPWAVTEGLLGGSAALLAPGAALILYGPFKRHGQHTSQSNKIFDASLRRRNAAWGVRDLEAVTELAGRHAFMREEIVEMPANNLIVVFRKQSEGSGGCSVLAFSVPN